MNKKLIAVAVAGALAAPALAFAQASTVQVYGLFKMEYGYAQQPDNAAGASRHNVDANNSGAGSNIGFKGEEKLGGGLSAFFQCESEIRLNHVTSTTAQAFCGRNSAVGLKGGFGKVYFGRWDSPIKEASGKTRMLNETGWMGAQHMLLAGEVFEFSERNPNSVNYDTPTMGGFRVAAQYTTTNDAVNDLSTNGNQKGRKLGLAAFYNNGPVVAVLGWARHTDNQTVAAGDGDTDTAWLAGVTYTFAKKFKAGVTFANNKLEDGAFDLKRKAWNLAFEWDVTKAGMVRLGYTHAGDYKGSLGAADTGAKQWQIGYHHDLSKRTSLGATYVKLDNDRLGSYNLTGLSNDVLGDNASAFVLHMYHRF